MSPLRRPTSWWPCGYKWLLGPYSVGYAWIAPQHRNWRPLEQHWAGREGSENFARLTNYTDAYREGARRFDGGEASNFALLPMAVAALETVTSWSVSRVQATIVPLMKAIVDGVGDLAQPRHEPHAPHIVGLLLPEGAAPRVAERLVERAGACQRPR